ncbi:MAG: ATP-binding protein [Cytophagales bacterium]|nr:ATP-binding protein [Cytophagales bacterium]
MTLKELQKLVEKGENEHVEFKLKLNHPDKIAHEIVAFGNTKGGTILIGVADDKTLQGLKNIDEQLYIFDSIIQKHIKYNIDYEIEIIKLNDSRHILAAHIYELKRKPNYALDTPSDKYGKAFVRYQDQCLQASREMVEILKQRHKPKNIIIKYSDTEKAILQHIENYGYATLPDLCTKVLLKEHTLSLTLINLVLANVLKIEPVEGMKDKYYYNVI